MNEIKRRIQTINDLLYTQGRDGNWDYDNYMLGMYNGMELMVAIMENREPIYKECKEEDFLYHKKISAKPETSLRLGNRTVDDGFWFFGR